MSKGRPRGFDKEQALEIALQLFWRHGYDGVSISKLCFEMGINVPSLYSAFGNKESLYYQSVELYSKRNGVFYHHAFALPKAIDVARAILLAEVALVTGYDTPDGCLMVQGALVTSPENEKLVKFMANLRHTAEGWMAQRFQKAIDEGDLPKTANANILACHIMTVNSGMAVQARSGVTKEQLLELVELALLPFK